MAAQQMHMDGYLEDKDSNFANLYSDGDLFIDGVLKRGDWH
jgi:hypothetical protein